MALMRIRVRMSSLKRRPGWRMNKTRTFTFHRARFGTIVEYRDPEPAKAQRKPPSPNPQPL